MEGNDYLIGQWMIYKRVEGYRVEIYKQPLNFLSHAWLHFHRGKGGYPFFLKEKTNNYYPLPYFPCKDCPRPMKLHRNQTPHPQKTTMHTQKILKIKTSSAAFFFLHIQNNNGGGSTVVEVVINSLEAFFLIKKIPSLPKIIWAACRDVSKALKLRLERGSSHPPQPSSPNHIADIDTTQPSRTKSQQINQAHQKKEKRNGKKPKNKN